MKYLLLVLTGLSVLSCSDNAPLLTQLSRSVEHDRKMVRGISFGRTLSLTAAVPFSDVGNVWRYDQKQGYTTAVGVTRNASYVSRSEIVDPKGYDETELQALQVALLRLQNLAAARVAARFDELVKDVGRRADLLAAAAAVERAPAPVPRAPALAPASAPVPAPPSRESVLPPLSPEPVESSDSSGSRYLFPPKLPTASIRALNKDRIFSIANQATAADLTVLPPVLHDFTISEHERLVSEFNSTYEEVANLVNQPGIVVMRWQTNNQSSGGFFSEGIGGASGSRSKGHGGLIVVAGLRQSVLHVGPDIMHLESWIPRGQVKRMKVTTHTLQTQRAFWVKDLSMESVFAAATKFDLRDKAIKNAVAAAQVEIALAQASISNLSSLGSFSTPQRHTEPVDWTEFGQRDLLNEPGWLTILTVDSEVRNLQSLIREKGWVWPAPRVK